MAKTTFGEFNEVYGHIDAPTNRDESCVGYKLIIPQKGDADCYRSPELAYLADNPWIIRRKLNGQNMRVYWDGEQVLWSGKSNKFVPTKDWEEYMNETLLEEIFEENFGRDKQVVLFGEGMGPKVQGNELGLGENRFVLFDVKINGIWLEKEAVQEIAKYFHLDTCYSCMSPALRTMPLYEIIQMVADGVYEHWEGIVATPEVGVLDRVGRRIICKIKNRDYRR